MPILPENKARYPRSRVSHDSKFNAGVEKVVIEKAEGKIDPDNAVDSGAVRSPLMKAEFRAETPGRGRSISQWTGKDLAANLLERLTGRIGHERVGVVDHGEKDRDSGESVGAESRQLGDGALPCVRWAVGRECKHGWECLRADRRESTDASEGPHGVGGGPGEPGQFRNGRAGFRTEKGENVHRPARAFLGAKNEATKARRMESSEKLVPHQGRLVADPFENGRDGVRTDGADCLLSFTRFARSTREPGRLAQLIDPLGQSAALVAGLGLPCREQCAYQAECEDSARKEDEPFPPLRHDTEMMEVLHA